MQIYNWWLVLLPGITSCVPTIESRPRGGLDLADQNDWGRHDVLFVFLLAKWSGRNCKQGSQ